MKTIKRRSIAAILMLLVGLASCSGLQESTAEIIPAEGPAPAIIPVPDSLSFGDNMYLLPKNLVVCHTEGAEESASWVRELLELADIDVKTSEGEKCGNWNIIKDEDLLDQLGKEGYTLNIDESGVTISSATDAGLFYAVQSLRQFFPAEIEQGKIAREDLVLRQAYIKDQPAFGWRGTMVDISRSFFGLDYLKRHIDRMALYKLNRLHLHLSDDQGWRIEMKGWPKLTEVGGKGSVVNGNSGFLTQENYRELQDYAADRNVMIIPEIDMPGHIYAALLSYPELNCDDLSNINPKKATPPDYYTGYQVGWSKLCLENPEIYEFVSEVIEELSEITDGPYIHIGGDEIKDPRYEEFVVKADSIVRSYGKTTIGWEEVTKAEVDESLISQQWHGRVESKVNVRTIKSFCTNFYLDHANIPGQEDTNNWCKEDGVSLEDVYSYAIEDENALGVEAAVWTEFVINEEMLDDRFWPRAIAMAEIGWSTEGNRNLEDFIDRLGEHGNRLGQLGVHFFQTPNVEWTKKEVSERPRSGFSNFNPDLKK